MVRYHKIEEGFTAKVWKELKVYPLQLISSNGENTYRFGTLIISEKASLNNEYYSLSTKEVLNVLDYYKILGRLSGVVIHNYQLRNLNGSDDVSNPKGDVLNLYKPIELLGRENTGTWKWREKFPERWQALFTLLHEIGHILGYKPKNMLERGVMEERADNFAKHEIDKFWKKLIRE